MTTLLLTHPACLDHDTGPHHPESAARLRAIADALAGPDFAGLARREAPEATIDALCRVHPRTHVDAVLAAIPRTGYAALDSDTIVSPGSGAAALHAAGAVVAAVDAVLNGKADNAFCAVRPPGHHAEPDRAMGFCLFDNVAVGARHAQAAHGLGRVAIVDFDVHHGNGTQALVATDDTLFYASSHQYPFYPGTGAASDRGRGNIVNVPLPRGAGGVEFRAAYTGRILPALRGFAPELILLSAGFDAHRADPLAELRLDEADFAWVTSQLLSVARECCAGRLVSALEGGYDLDALGKSVAAHVNGLMAASPVAARADRA